MSNDIRRTCVFSFSTDVSDVSLVFKLYFSHLVNLTHLSPSISPLVHHTEFSRTLSRLSSLSRLRRLHIAFDIVSKSSPVAPKSSWSSPKQATQAIPCKVFAPTSLSYHLSSFQVVSCSFVLRRPPRNLSGRSEGGTFNNSFSLISVTPCG